MNLNSRLATVIFALGSLAGCGAVDPTGGLPPEDAQLAILNALDPGIVASLELDGEPITLPAAGTRIARVIPAGGHRLAALGTARQVLSAVQFTVAAGGRRTAVLGGSATGGTATLVVGADTASIPRPTAAKVRIVNTVQGIPALEAWLVVDGQPVNAAAKMVAPFYGVGLGGQFPGYVERAAGSYRIRVASQATGATAINDRFELLGGEVWSLVLIRLADGELGLVPVRER